MLMCRPTMLQVTMQRLGWRTERLGLEERARERKVWVKILGKKNGDSVLRLLLHVCSCYDCDCSKQLLMDLRFS